jgi:2-polyprenyl-6-methoxyphenol hydroxylase-like FAD-dependent oxidoreductase
MAEHDVIIAGGGPTGLMLGAELRLAGIDVAIVERRPDQHIDGLRSGGLHARTIEILDQRGVADRFLSEGKVAQVTGYAGIRLDISDFPTRHPYGLGLWQNDIERILADWAEELEVGFYRGREVTGFIQDSDGVEVRLSDGRSLRGAYLVGCDGGRSLVRKSAGIDFPGWDATISNLIGEVEMAQEPPLGTHQSSAGLYAFGRRDYEIVDGAVRFADSGPINVMVPEQNPANSGEPTLRDLRDALVAVCGTDYDVRSAAWISRFTDMARQAASYRKGRVLLAGDAAHIHSPVGGQGLNTGVQDAVNLGWKLASVVKGTSPDSLLDTYHGERHPVGARVLRNSLAQVALLRPDERTEAARAVLAELLEMEEPRKRIAAMMSGLDIRYDLGRGHPLLGRRVPDLDLVTGDRPGRLYNLLHQARPVLLNLSESVELGGGPWPDRVRLVSAHCLGPWTLPAVGSVTAPSALLIRPDGHVAWVGEESSSGLDEALGTWFGPPAHAGGKLDR